MAPPLLQWGERLENGADHFPSCPGYPFCVGSSACDSAAAKGVHNVQPVLREIDNPKLAAGIVDLVLLVDAYHEFSHPFEMMTELYRALKRGGRVALVEYRGEDPTVPIKPRHKMTEAQARKEMEAVGLKWVETRSVLPQQHLMFFRKED